MECPFELPVHKEDWIIIDILGNLVVTVEHLDEADYVVQVINSHEKLVEALKNILEEAFRETDRLTWASDLCKQAEQAIEGK